MFAEEKEYKLNLAGKDIIVKTGKYCGQANGTCQVRCGDTVIMVNVTMSDKAREGADFFPLCVDFEEKMYAVGKFPGGYKKREGRASDQAILYSRLIDRPIRPLFPKGFYNDVAVVATALSVDPDYAPEILAMIGSSVALSVSDIPFAGPTGSVLVGMIDGKYVINPTLEEQERSAMHTIVSGTKEAILMVEAGAHEVSEEEMTNGILFAHEYIKEIVKFIEDIAADTGKPKKDVELFHIGEDVEKDVRDYVTENLKAAMEPLADKVAYNDRIQAVLEDCREHFAEKYEEREQEVDELLYKMQKEIVRKNIIERSARPDGRQTKEIRPIWCEDGVLPRVHGTGVFTRGETQVLNCLTLATISEAQRIDGLDDSEDSYKRYIHQYNMPPYATGEARNLKSPGRREIGHGALAERALVPVIPSEEEFPYALRLVSEVLGSNGSSSMASVCASTLSLMDAGVPIKAPVAGVAMGLIKDDASGKVVVLTDIQGLEDFFGDMDFKVAGTKKGITAIQMDIKIRGIDKNILTTALAQAREGRLEIMDKMLATIAEPRESLSKYAPKIITFKINPEKIGEVIGQGGKTINKIIEKTGVKIDIEDDGTVMVSSANIEDCNAAKAIIEDIVFVPEIGERYTGSVVRIMQFGAFVEISSTCDGMIHISKLSTKRVERVEDVVKIGDKVEVEVIKVDEKGRVDLKLVKKIEG
ncbi:MAG: polyribonucleotide nucleotidyltransferase [Clostridia bacterium]|nr:polyribonucleotide nucleotidyltransferase [Clostridia bacterium]